MQAGGGEREAGGDPARDVRIRAPGRGPSVSVITLAPGADMGGRVGLAGIRCKEKKTKQITIHLLSVTHG